MIKAICLDINGTVLAYNQNREGVNTKYPPRKGLKYLFDHCKKKNKIIIATSDQDIVSVKRNLKDCFKNFPELELDIGEILDFYTLDEPFCKDYSKISRSLGIPCEEILVFGDSMIDYCGAKKHKCLNIIVPEYVAGIDDCFDFENVSWDEIESKSTCNRINEI